MFKKDYFLGMNRKERKIIADAMRNESRVKELYLKVYKELHSIKDTDEFLIKKSILKSYNKTELNLINFIPLMWTILAFFLKYFIDAHLQEGNILDTGLMLIIGGISLRILIYMHGIIRSRHVASFYLEVIYDIEKKYNLENKHIDIEKYLHNAEKLMKEKNNN